MSLSFESTSHRSASSTIPYLSLSNINLCISIFYLFQYMFLYTVELLVKVDQKLGVEIELDFYRRVLSNKESESQLVVGNSCEVVDSVSSSMNRNGSISLPTQQSHEGPKNGVTSAVHCSIPPVVRQRRRLRRFRQELEAVAVWLKRDKVTNALTNQAAFGTRLLEASGTGTIRNTNNRTNSSSNSSSSRVDDKSRGRGSEPSLAVASIVSDVLKNAQVTALQVRRLAEMVFG